MDELTLPLAAPTFSRVIPGPLWCGIRLPPGIRAFDCRSAEDAPLPRAPGGETLYASETACVDLGLNRGWNERNAAMICGGTISTTPAAWTAPRCA